MVLGDKHKVNDYPRQNPAYGRLPLLCLASLSSLLRCSAFQSAHLDAIKKTPILTVRTELVILFPLSVGTVLRQ